MLGGLVLIVHQCVDRELCQIGLIFNLTSLNYSHDPLDHNDRARAGFTTVIRCKS